MRGLASILALEPTGVLYERAVLLRNWLESRRKRRKNRSLIDLSTNLVISGSSPRVQKTKEIHRVSADGQKAAVVFKWTVPNDCSVEIHGHCLAIYSLDRTKIAEARIESSGPVVLREITSDKQRSIAVSSTSRTTHRLHMMVKYGAFELVDRGVSAASGKWARWQDGERPVTYLLEEPKTTEGRLRAIVMFSAIGDDYDFTYNYRSSLSGVDAYRIYILDDFGKRGAYYYSDHRDDGIYRSVQLLLRHLFAKLRLVLENVTFAGSSKGGTAALIHGLPLGVGNIVVGAPQFKPGTYLYANAPEMLEFIAGGQDEGSRGWLDEMVVKIISAQPSASLIRIIVGRADHHYQAHAIPLVAELRKTGYRTDLLVMKGVTHQEIGRPFSAYLSRLVRFPVTQSAATVSSLLPYELSWQGEEGSKVAVLRLWIPVGEVVALRAYARGKLVASFAYSANEVYSVSHNPSLPLRFRVYRRSVSTKRRAGVFTTHWLRPQ